MVTVVAPSQRNVALNTIVAAFTADPLLRWIFQQADVYTNYASQSFNKVGGAAFSAGAAFEIDNYAGVALWIPPAGNDHEADDSVMSELLAGTVAAERIEEVGANGRLSSK